MISIKSFYSLSCGVFLCLFSSCANDENISQIIANPEVEPQPEIISGEYSKWNLSKNGESVRLYVGIDSIAENPEYTWYEVKDGVDTKLDKQINNFFDTGDFASKCIKSFKCKETFISSSDSLVNVEYLFHVAYTGLPLIAINTENHQPVTSKEEKVSGNMVVMGGGRYHTA